MKKIISKTKAEKQIEDFFENIDIKSPKEIKKIKRLAMSHKIPLKEKRKLFCKKCFNVHSDSSIRVKKGVIRIECGNCGNVSRWKIKI